MTLKKATDTSFVCTLTPFLLQRQLSLLTVISMSSRDPAWYQDQVPLADKTLVDQDLCHLPQLGETLLVSVEPTGGRLLTSLPLQKVPGWKMRCQFVEQPQFIFTCGGEEKTFVHERQSLTPRKALSPPCSWRDTSRWAAPSPCCQRSGCACPPSAPEGGYRWKNHQQGKFLTL